MIHLIINEINFSSKQKMPKVEAGFRKTGGSSAIFLVWNDGVCS